MANSYPPVTASITTLLPDQPGYPARLGRWKQPPLYVRGALPPTVPTVAIVGARAASGKAMARAEELGAALVARGHHVVSGGALGIDGAAHRGALASTTVVLGCGVDVAYPARHAQLFDRILASGGGLMSMLEPGQGPRSGTFVQRNPLIAALADAVVVVEADVKSGSLSTAAAATKLGRVLCAYPGSPGCDRLIARGAARITGLDDLDAAIAGTPRVARGTEDPVAAQLRAAIAAGAKTVDALVTATGLPVRTVVRTLGQMEKMS